MKIEEFNHIMKTVEKEYKNQELFFEIDGKFIIPKRIITPPTPEGDETAFVLMEMQPLDNVVKQEKHD